MTLSAAQYPPLEPYRTGRLAVSERHELYFEESGNPRGKPVVCLHGGPGFGSDPGERRMFDPSVYRIVMFDQRGSGRSTPFASLEENTTWHLVADLETLRSHLRIAQWQLFGGSWGSTLALAYAQTHPEAVTELVLRGIFLLRKEELDWFYQEGASALYPDAWERLVSVLRASERRDVVGAFHRRLTSNDVETEAVAARAWSAWEASTCSVIPDPALVRFMTDDRLARALARIETHYFVHGAWLEGRELLAGIERLRHLRCVIVQGRFDVVCPMRSAWALQRAWPEAELRIVEGAGHSAYEPGILRELRRATDRFRP